MKPRKIQIIKNMAANEKDPFQLAIMIGVIKLFEWPYKVDEILGTIENDESLINLYRSEAAKHCPGYFCSYSKNFFLDNEKLAVDFEISDIDGARNMRAWTTITLCAEVRDLSEAYCNNKKLKKLIDQMIEGAASDANERRSLRNILNLGSDFFLSDFEIDQVRNGIIKQNQALIK